ncbi:DMSO/selenate family reductase complex A subunit [Uliginosibacterium sp. sgz301328]|uniref:DMSO/selenate family reductase complex A subunit n=1 Tax=Uliginosibacterium sp. sgz301328 TaxID=3243764 RepID=UPI00359D179F
MDDHRSASKTESRRDFFKLAGLLSATPFIAGGVKATQSAGAPAAAAEKVVQTCSTFDCGGKCVIRTHIKDGAVVRISTIADAEINPDMPVMRACVRGRSYRRFVYNPDRLKYPMVRVGKRGEGKFKRVSWDEATTLIAQQMKRITDAYGPASRFCTVNTAGSSGAISGDVMARRLLNLTGGFLDYYHSVSMGNTLAATPYTYGTPASGSGLDSLLDTKLVILWGHNPTETVFGHTNHYFQEMKRRGTKFIVVDPRYSDSTAAYGSEWIPILPTTDNALMDAMAYVIVTENLHDAKFLSTYCVGFDEAHMPEGVPANESLMAYLTGKKDGVAKTPEWAERICKVPALTIRRLAREYATTKPAALIQGWGPQRHICGERTARGSAMLACITGNVGVKGGWAGGYGGIGTRKGTVPTDIGTNAVKGKISIMNWMQAVEDASKVRPEDGLKEVDQLSTNIKMIFCLAGNYLASQNPDVNAAARLLADESKVEFIVCSDLYLTPSAKFADVLLPETSFMERWNIGKTWGSGNYLMLSEQVIEPLHEARNDYDWLTDVARKLGVEQEFTLGRSQKDWIEAIWEATRLTQPSEELPDFNTLQTQRIAYFKNPEPYVAFKKEIDDPAAHPFKTPSGKIELFSKRLYDMNDPDIPALSHYVPAVEGPQDEATSEYPLQLITWKGKNRANSTFFANPWLKEAQTQKMWINPIDARARGVKQGDMVRAFNKRGTTVIVAEVTTRIMPGVVALQSAAWWQPDANGIDRGGCANVLSSTRITPLAKGNAHQTILVQVAKA